MKKILFMFLIIISSILSLNIWNASYLSTWKDKLILEHFHNKINKVDNKKIQSIKWIIYNILVGNTDNNRMDYLIENIYNYMNLKNNNKYYKIIKIIDGDTVKIIYNWKKTSIRLLWIDTPESYKTRFGYKECYGDEAKHYLTNLLSWQKIRLEFDKTQSKRWKYWRLIAYIYYNNINMNKLMVREWYAWEYTYDKAYKFQKLFKKDELYAKQHKIWLWNKNTCDGKRLRVKDIKKNTSNQLFDNLKISCDHYISCSKMKSCDEAKMYFKKCWWKRMDWNHDWIPCQNICWK